MLKARVGKHIEEVDVRGVDHWTAAAVAEAVIEAFRNLPDIPVYSPRRADLIPVNPRHDGTPIDVIAWSEQILGRASDERRALLVWARAMARRRIRQDRRLRLVRSVPGGSVSDHCREVGICRRTFDRRRIRACEQIAVDLNRNRSEAASVLDDLRIETPEIAASVDRLMEALATAGCEAHQPGRLNGRISALSYPDGNE